MLHITWQRLLARGRAASPAALGVAALTAALGAGAAPALAAPRQIVVATAAITDVLDPHKTVGEPGTIYVANVFDSLVRLNPNPKDGRGRHLPALAKSWTTAPDGRSIDFVLNTAAKFQDMTPVTAEDVKFSIERAIAPATKNPYASSWLGNIAGVDILAPDKVRLRLKFAWSGTLDALAARAEILPKAYLTRVGDAEFARHPIGTGPYKVTGYKRSDRIELTAFEGYWGTPPAASKVIWRAVPDINTRVALLTSGGADLITNLLPGLVKLAQSNGLTVDFRRGAFQRFIEFNTIKGGPLADRRVRLAMNIAIDRKTLFNAVFGRDVEWVNGPSSSFQVGGDAAPPYPYDPAKAKELLKEAGFANGFKTELIYAPGRYIGDEELLPSLVSYWKKIGVDVRLVSMEYSSWLQAVQDKAFTGMAAFAKAPGQVADPFSSFDRHIRCGAVYSAYCNKDIDALVETARGSIDAAKLKAVFAKAQLMAHDDAAAIFLFDEPAILAHKPSVTWNSEFGPDLGIGWNAIGFAK